MNFRCRICGQWAATRTLEACQGPQVASGEKAFFDHGELAGQLQRNGAKAFVDSWNELRNRIEAQTSAVA